MIDRKEIKNILYDLRNISSEYNGLYLSEIERLEELVDENKYKVAIIGEFSSGKSTFLNALSGKRILYSSNDEATGVITYLEASSKKIASVFMDDDSVEEIDMSSENSYEKLSNFVDIRNKDANIDSIGIYYPLKGIDKEVCFIDTPGLQGISKKQMEITREVIKKANATIMLITEKGLSQTELDILTGKNVEFGRVNTKEVFVVINKIGKIHSKGTKEEILEKIESIKAGVIKTLKENGIDGVKIFTVDSRDYLWSQDNDLYNTVKETTNPEVEKIFDQEVYRERSQFGKFKEFLFQFLEAGNRNKSFIEDISFKISCIIDAFSEQFLEEKGEDINNENYLVKQLNNQKELLMKNRRKLYNSLARYIGNSFQEFNFRMKEDIESLNKDKSKSIALIIDEKFNNKRDINQINVNKCCMEINNAIKRDIMECESKLNEYKRAMTNYLINKRLNEDFMKILNNKSNVKLDIKQEDIKVDIKFNEVKLQEDKRLEIINDEIKQVEEECNEINSKLQKYKNYNPEIQIRNLKREKVDVQARYQREKNSLGSRPKPRQKTKTVARKERVFLFIKKTVYDEVPDGFDYSECEAWDRKMKNITQNYNNKINEIENKIDEYESLDTKIKNLDKQKQNCLQRKVELNNEKIKAKVNIEKKKRENEIKFVQDKKNTLFKDFKKRTEGYYKNLQEKIECIICDIVEDLKTKIKDGVENYLDSYSKKLDIEIENINKNIVISSEQQNYILNKLNELKERI